MEIKVVGIDPALQNFGFAKARLDLETLEVRVDDLILVSTAGADRQTRKAVRKNSDDLRRARILYEGMLAACEGAAWAFVEVPHGSQSARAMASYGMCVGVLAACPIPLIQVTSAEVKMAAIGDKEAAKEEMIEWGVKQFPAAPWLTQRRKGALRLLDKNEHLADACAAIMAGIKTDQLRQALAVLGAARAA